MNKTIKKEKVCKNLVICCTHILKSLKAKKKIKMFEVLKDTFVCEKCAEKEPKTKKEFMKMFATVCRDCIKNSK